ncbi:MAG: ATP-dependent helicase [Acidobacteriota bacterium]
MKRFVLKGRGVTPTFRIPYEEELNAEQLDVVTAGEGPLLCIAGAGTGKTRTLTYRVARLVESGVPPEQICLLTFTNKAAREMLHRVEVLLGTSSLRVAGGTFHHLGNMILRRYAGKLGLGNNFSILDRGDSRDLLRSVEAEKRIDRKSRRLPNADTIVAIGSFAINTLRSLEDVVAERYSVFSEDVPVIAELLAGYQERKRRISAVDYDDLLLLWLELLDRHPDAGEELERRFRFVLVDEYQDTNRLQGVIIDRMARAHRNITVVGDDAQSIYAFRGARHENILSFPERYENARVCRLVTNYRSQPRILTLANASIACNARQFKKELRAVRPPGPDPVLARCRDLSQQAALVCELVLHLFDEGRDPSDVAVLYRSNYQSMEIQTEMTRRKIPFLVYGGIRFFEQAHIKDVVAYLRVIENPKDELAWMRVLPLVPKVGARTAARIAATLRDAPVATAATLSSMTLDLPQGARAPFRELCKLMGQLEALRDGSPADLVAMVVEGSYEAFLKEKFPNWRSRREDLTQLTSFASGFRKLSDFLGELALLGNTEAETVVAGPGDERPVTLTTVHQAKGLEWPCVIVAGLCDGGFPASMALRDPDGEEEERRLFYVAVTRAKDELYLTAPLMRYVRGQGAVVQKPSRFLTELPGSVVEEMEVDDQTTQGYLPEPTVAPRLQASDDGFADPEPDDADWFAD